MPTREEYASGLRRLAAMLCDKPMTARAIAAAFKCSRVAAYERVEALRKSGMRIYETPVRERPTGPISTAYGFLRLSRRR